MCSFTSGLIAFNDVDKSRNFVWKVQLIDLITISVAALLPGICQ